MVPCVTYYHRNLTELCQQSFTKFAPTFLEGLIGMVEGKAFPYCATCQKVAGPIPVQIFAIFFIEVILLSTLWPWGRLSLLTEVSTRDLPWGVRAAGT